MDTLDLGKQNILTSPRDTRGGLDNISSLNELRLHSQLFRTMAEFTEAENPYTKTLWSLEPEVQGKC